MLFSTQRNTNLCIPDEKLRRQEILLSIGYQPEKKLIPIVLSKEEMDVPMCKKRRMIVENSGSKRVKEDNVVNDEEVEKINQDIDLWMCVHCYSRYFSWDACVLHETKCEYNIRAQKRSAM